MVNPLYWILTSLILLYLSCPVLCQPDTVQVQGQSQVNILRHTVAVSNLPSQFGKHGHILLTRSVVPPHRVWKAIDAFTLNTLSNPERLDWYVADYSTDGRRTITINAAFSCLDVGRSTARPLYWWASLGYSELTNKSQEIGGAEVDLGSHGDGSINDMTERCLDGRKPKKNGNPDYRLVEHSDQHRGTGVSFITRSLPKSVVNDYGVFEALEKQRLAEDRSNEAIYHESGLPVTYGLTFDTGLRVWVTPEFRTDKTLDLRAPFTPVCAITKHSGARLEESRVAEGETSTNTSTLVLTVLATGLPLLLAVWWVVKHVCDTMVYHSHQCRALSTQQAIARISSWSMQEKVLLIMNLFGVTILVAPFALAIAEGTIDPRISVEVTTGATVFYGSSHPGLSEDQSNAVAGAPFVVTVWMSVRHLGCGFTAALIGSLLLILFLAVAIYLRVSKRSNELMPGSRSKWTGFSCWKMYGSLLLFLKSLQHGDEKRYKLLLELYDDDVDEDGVADLEGKRKEVLLMPTQEMRERANTRVFRENSRRRDRQMKLLARESLHDELMKHGRSKYRLLCKVRMDNRTRYKAAMSQSTVFDRHLPREWEYVRRSIGHEGIDWYRTNGVMPPDEFLIFARLGLLSYMKYVRKMIIKEEMEPDTGEYDDDGVRMILIISPIRNGFEATELGGDAPKTWVIDDSERVPQLFTKQISSCLMKVPWKLGSNEEALQYGGGILHISYVVMEEEEASMSDDVDIS